MKGTIAIGVTAALLLTPAGLWAQQPRAGHETSASAMEPFDPTGYWVSMITHDWMYRMVVPQRGRYIDLPVTLKAKEFADAWRPGPDEAAGKQCEAYGAAAIMQVPERLQISWQDPNTLKVQTDAGMQTRLLHFKADPVLADASPSRQGYSQAQWMLYRPPRGVAQQRGAAPSRHGWLRISTSDMLPGLLRKNGVPYSAETGMTENWELNIETTGDEWLTVTTILTDPEFLAGRYVENAIFRKESDGSKWDPTPCTLKY